MGSRGPAPKPSELRKLAGTGHRPLPENEPVPQRVLAMETPRHWYDLLESSSLGPEERERIEQQVELKVRIWHAIGRELINMKVLGSADLPALERYADIYSLWYVQSQFIARFGTSYSTYNQNGDTVYKTYPEFTNYIALSTQLTKLEAQFGLTPSARARVKTILDGGTVPANFDPLGLDDDED